jgi:hypothetical protein
MGRTIYDWAEVQKFYDSGATEAQTRKHWRLFPSTFSKAVKSGRLTLRPDDANRPRTGPGNSKYDWAAVQVYYDAGHTYRECAKHFGFCSASWTKAVRRGLLTARARLWPIQRTLREAKSRATIKRRLLEAGILENRCEWCGITEWRGKPISIQIDHANGIRDDHRRENLRMLCPNCHSQTETFGAKNRRKNRQRETARLPSRVAQLAERHTLNVDVVRSIRTSGASGPIV